MPSVSVVVPATNAPPTLDRCLQALRAGTSQPDELVVVDEPCTTSAAEARNVGAARVRGDVVCFVDADVAVHPDAVARIRRAFETQPTLTAVFGAYDDTPTVRTTVSVFRNLLHHHVHSHHAGPADTFWSGIGAVRRDAFLAAGGFDGARYRVPSIEDVDLGRRLVARGAEIVLDPAIQGTHLKRWTLRSMLWTDFARRGVPWVALELRGRRLSSSLNLGWRHRASLAASVAGMAAAVIGSWLVAAAALVALVALNRSFYVLLARRQGVTGVVAGVPLHVAHHLVAAAAIPVGVAVAAREALVGQWARRRTRVAAVPVPVAGTEVRTSS